MGREAFEGQEDRCRGDQYPMPLYHSYQKDPTAHYLIPKHNLFPFPQALYRDTDRIFLNFAEGKKCVMHCTPKATPSTFGNWTSIL